MCALARISGQLNGKIAEARVRERIAFLGRFRKRLRKGSRKRVMYPALIQRVLGRSALAAAIAASAIAVAVGVRLARVARPLARWAFDGNEPAVEVVAEGREPGVADSDRQPIVAGRVRQPALSQFAGRRSCEHAGAARRDRCRDRQGRLGEAVQPVPQRRAAASRLVGVARGRSRDRQHLHVHRRRATDLRRAGRQECCGIDRCPTSTAR